MMNTVKELQKEKKEKKELQKENAALAATVEALREAWEAVKSNDWDAPLDEAFSTTPQQHLEEAKAQARRDALKPLRDEWEKKDAHEVSTEEKLERLVNMIYKSTETI